MQKKLLYVIAILLLIVGSFVGGAYYGKNQQASADSNITAVTTTTTATITKDQAFGSEYAKDALKEILTQNASTYKVSINLQQKLKDYVIGQAKASGSCTKLPDFQQFTMDKLSGQYGSISDGCLEGKVTVSINAVIYQSDTQKDIIGGSLDVVIDGSAKRFAPFTDCSKTATIKIHIEGHYDISYNVSSGQFLPAPPDWTGFTKVCEVNFSATIPFGKLDKAKCCKKILPTPDPTTVPSTD